MGFYCGEFRVPELIRLPLNDFGITHGVMLTEQLRTFGGIPLLLDRHLQRLESGARTLAIPVSISVLRDAINTVVDHNFSLLNPGCDIRISILVTPGTIEDTIPTIIVTTAVLPFAQLAREYDSGIHLVTVDTREIPGNSIPRHLKHRNRIHYWLAEQEARQVAPDARALLFDFQGNICEATTASIAMVRIDEGIIAPAEPDILGSISMATSLELLSSLGHKIIRRKFMLDELRTADEILWFSSPMCVLPVSKLNNEVVGANQNRAVFQTLVKAWNELAGFDLLKQAFSAAGDG